MKCKAIQYRGFIKLSEFEVEFLIHAQKEILITGLIKREAAAASQIKPVIIKLLQLNFIILKENRLTITQRGLAYLNKLQGINND